MTERERLEAAAAALEKELGGLDELTATAEAEGVLGELASALFPGGEARREQLTWPEGEGPRVERDTIEERLKRAEARFKTLVEQIPAVTFMAVLGEGANEVYVSPHIEAMLGYRQDEWLADPFLWYRQLHPDDRVLWNTEFARGCRAGGPFRAECRFLARDGHTVWVHGEARILRDDLGRPLFLQGVAFDITESKRAQAIVLEQSVRAARADEELAIARRVQTTILPRAPQVPGLEIAAVMLPASEVGGDYYDVLPVAGGGDGCWMAIGDVSGHGLSAGLVMLMLQSALASAVRALPAALPTQILRLCNETLYDNIRMRIRGDDHVTVTLLRYFPDGRLVLGGAHEDLLLWRAATGAIQLLRPPGTWLGGMRDIGHVTTNVEERLDPGDVLLLYTDGVTEAMDARGEQWNIDRLAATLAEVHDRSVEEIRDAIVSRVRAWMSSQADDITLVVVRYVG